MLFQWLLSVILPPIPIRLITHNVRYANDWPVTGEVKWEQRRNFVTSNFLFNTRYIPEAFIGLQEAYFRQVEDILEGLNDGTPERDWTYIGVGRDDGKESGEYSPILYRKGTYELLDFTTVWLSPTPDRPSKGWDAPYWNRILTIGEFKHRKTGRQLVVMNTHLDDQGVVARQKSAELIVNRTNTLLDTKKYAGVLLMGDFNSEASEDAYKTIEIGENSPFVDVATYFKVGEVKRYGHLNTFTGFDWKPLKRIDFLFAAPREPSRWSMQGYAVMETKYEDGVASSDHRPVIADLVLN
ncbi:SubName: Full=Related to endonuclease/exonuclease/phosphatase family protein-Penicillium marneffei {ECO:0000313/EMBL:CCA66416.1} [Serendipita indica DSM 11827]|uniref:Related to endonuclease/exonuclease/phosphatase family protein-Penicillium marneffei n=1 Tax=Serendipita indica (strain DSM 11827) TaxID=1109443 RepID=G4T4Y3_SERID|nr:SubName: Full=Related to endonuclease/exonuclease/phosphatase family protein-Penicillium marneffei {ECO:0000313/EMBL:CCA66416.1} [Serendipita indica DSM 11827]CCA66416.1 related to endonuclease/exonuclease/phosphatase family protein-Penicillium marneffei [Serendipita indica DSM 11827]